jgi:DNA-binding PadR family transcriptional regulator
MSTPPWKKRYAQSEKGRAKIAENAAKPERKRVKLAWGREKGLASRREAQRRYRAGPKYAARRAVELARHKAYRATEHGQAVIRRIRGQPEPTRPRPHFCECCGAIDLVLDKPLCLDHDHRTGAFRGWICDSCNVGIGRLGDNLEGARNAVAYLEKNG